MRAYTGRPTTPTGGARRRSARRGESARRDLALGMGFDHPPGFVVHLGAPPSPVAYYQQVGRAGRALEHAVALLLPGPAGPDIWEWFATSMLVEDHARRRSHGDGRRQGLVGGPAPETVPRRPPVAARSCCSRCSPWTAQWSGCRAAGASTGRPWIYDARTVCPRHPHARGRATVDDRLRQAGRRGRVPHVVPPARPRRPDPAAPCGRCDVCAGAWYSADVPEAAAEAGDGGADRPGVELAAAGPVADRGGPPRRRRQGQDRRRRPARARPGPSPA